MMTTRRALILLSWLMLLSASALGQSSKAIPRLNDGKPDMQGYWTNQTFTPLERPAQFKDKEFFTAEEAEAFAKRALDDVKDVPRGEEVKSDADIHYDDGIWLLEGYKKGAMLRTSIVTDPADGRIPPLTAEGQKRAQARAEARKGIGPFDSAQARGLSERCIYWAHEGPPVLPTGYNSNLLIVQAPGTFVIQPEMMPVARVVPLDGRPKLGPAHPWLSWRLARPLGRRHDGHRDHQLQREDGVARGLREPQGDRAAHDDEPDDDPLSVHGRGSRPRGRGRGAVSTEMTRIEGPLFEYACHEGNYQLPSILKGARRAEQK